KFLAASQPMQWQEVVKNRRIRGTNCANKTSNLPSDEWRFPSRPFRSTPMIRLFAAACTLFALTLFVGDATVDAQAKKNQMVKGTIKLVDTSKDLLVINQKVKNETVDRELSI